MILLCNYSLSLNVCNIDLQCNLRFLSTTVLQGSVALFRVSGIDRYGSLYLQRAQGDHKVLPVTHTRTIPTFTPQPQGVTDLWLVLIAPSHEGMARLSWPGWLVTYRDKCPAPRIVLRRMNKHSRTVSPIIRCYHEMRNVVGRLRGWPVPRDVHQSAAHVKHAEVWYEQRCDQHTVNTHFVYWLSVLIRRPEGTPHVLLMFYLYLPHSYSI